MHDKYLKDKKTYSHIIWDWNGTLFDDVNWCMNIINRMLSIRNIKTLDSIAEYHKSFCFPIVDYYKNVGFDFSKQSFEELAQEYISIYHSEESGNCKLHKDVKQVLEMFRDKEIIQIVLSASEINNLTSQMNMFGIIHFFDEIIGLSDVYAKSKIDIGLDYISRKKVNNALLVGDTEHDLEVANALGVDCILVANGHQSREKLLKLNIPIVDDILQVVEYI